MSRALHVLAGLLVGLVVGFLAGRAGPEKPAIETEAVACRELPSHRPKKGTQGWRTWSDEGLRAFDQGGAWFCLPEGWRPVGALEADGARARWSPKQTAVLVADDAWEHTLKRYSDDFPVQLFWSRRLSAALLAGTSELVAHAFAEIGALFPPPPAELGSSHDLLVTVGHAGNTRSYDTRIYPRPGPEMSVVVRDPEQSRGHELTIHAVAHLHNRHRLPERDVEPPLPRKDFEELVATWTESAFIRSHRGRLKRLRYLYNVHVAVQTGDHALITGPPFDDEARFRQITPNAVVGPDQPSVDMQYGHYILAPLSMVGAEGLLAEAGVADTMVEVVRDTFHGELDLFGELEERIGPEGIATMKGWLHGGETIPEELVWAGAERYRDRYQQVGG